jgi:hypothetical protein
MHRLASKAWQNHKDFTGISITGKPIIFIKKAPLFRFVDLKNVLRGKLATVTQIPFFADSGYLKEKYETLSPFPCLSPGIVSEPIFTYLGEKISN